MEYDFESNTFHTISQIIRSLKDSDVSADCLGQAHGQLTAILRNLNRAHDIPRISEMAALVQEVLADIDLQKRALGPHGDTSQPTMLRRPRGRSLFHIPREQLVQFVENGFSVPQMAKMLHVSRYVIKRRLREYGIRIGAKYSNLSDDHLDSVVQNQVTENRNLGQRMVQARLRSEGHLVQRERIAASMIRTDATGVAMRWAQTIRRRVYKVSGPNALWHIDGNHKLIRWGFVIHGGIDGFSRLVTFLRVSTNNAAATMTDAFMSGVERYGVPSRLRSDHGLENTGVGAFMLAYRGTGRGSFITGRSVHNQRIERLWRDVFQSCTNVFHKLFYQLERDNKLDPSNDLELWCLHFVFLPRIQRALDVFMNTWNNHRLRTEGGMSPSQLFLQGIVERAGQGQRGIDDLVYEPPLLELDMPAEEYGIEESERIASESHSITNVSNCPMPLTNELLGTLNEMVNPLEGGNLEVDAFSRALEFVTANTD